MRKYICGNDNDDLRFFTHQNDQLLLIRVIRDVERSDGFFEIFVSGVFCAAVDV